MLQLKLWASMVVDKCVSGEAIPEWNGGIIRFLDGLAWLQFSYEDPGSASDGLVLGRNESRYDVKVI